MNRGLSVLIILCCFGCPVFSQINIDVATQDASCSGKGTITVSASGGKLPYSYEIIANTCSLNNKPLQSSPIFNGLTSCTYTVKVIDADGKSSTKAAIVGGDYIGPSASVAVSGCSFIINVRNGSAPIQYAISTDGGKSYAPPTTQNIYSNLAEGTYFLKIEDACNSTYITSATIDLDTLEYYFVRIRALNVIHDSIMVNGIRGGQGPFQFFIVNGVDTLKNSVNRFALKDIVKTCNTKVVINTGCGVYTRRFDFVDTEIGCLNYSLGTVEFKVNVGVGPYISFNYFANTSAQVPGLKINDLIKNNDYYSFGVKDACGDFSNSNDLMYRVRPELSFTTKKECTEFSSSTLTISQNNPRKSGFDVECITCNPVTKYTGITTSTPILNLNTGKKTLVITDSCGTRWTCMSEYIIPVTESCDSIKLSLVNSFLCDNRTSGNSFSGDTIPADMFYLRRLDGVLIDSSGSGVFRNLVNGQYKVEGRSASCGLIQGSYSRDLMVQAPKYRIGINQFNNDCKIYYVLNVDFDFFPYSLTDLSGKSIAANAPVNTQFGPYYNNLLPGRYILKSLKNCWQDTINLPVVEAKLKLENITVCPAGGSVTVSGGKSFTEWKAYYATQNLDLYFINNTADWYDFSRISRFNYDTAQHTYYNIEPGKTYTIYLHSIASINYSDISNTCAIDSLTFTVPTYAPPSLISDLSLKCDQTNTLLSQLKIAKGTKPFVIQEIDCLNQNLIGSPMTTSDSTLAFTNLSLANHCFKITDACQNTAITESTIGDLNANIQSLKNCDSTTTFYFSTILGAGYRWTNKANQVIGLTPSITITDPASGEEIRLSIDFKGCGINKSLPITSTTLQKLGVSIHPNKIIRLCRGGSIKLSPSIVGGLAPFTYLWSTGSSDSTITIMTQGKYGLKITTATGCIVEDSVELVIGSPLIVSSTITRVSCFGDSTGSIRNTISGGFKPYTYEWSDGTRSDSIQNRPAGSYTLTLTDDAGCMIQHVVVIGENMQLNGLITSTIATCDVSKDGQLMLVPQGGISPYKYLWSDGSQTKDLINTNPGNYSVTLTDALSCTRVLSAQVQKKPLISVNRIDTICAGLAITVGNSRYTISGSYIDTLKNRLGCDSVVRTSLLVKAPLQYTINSKNPTCNDLRNGEILIDNINSKGPYQFLINNMPFPGLATNILASGNYVVKLIDGHQCALEKGVALANPPKITLEVGKDTILQFGDSLSLQVLTNVNNADIKKISWTGSPGYTCDVCRLQAVLKPKQDINYKVEIETTLGCKAQDLFTVKVNSDFRTYAPNILKLSEGNTADRNNRFTIYGPSYLEMIDYLKIFNRYGTLVFEVKNIPANDVQFGWDGTFKGQKTQSGVYIYVASVLFSDNNRRILKGDLTVVD